MPPHRTWSSSSPTATISSSIVASQEKGFYQRDAHGALRFDAACQPIAATATETYDYDELQRLTGRHACGTGMNSSRPPRRRGRVSYDDLGNITSKSDYVDRTAYGAPAGRMACRPGPDAVTFISMARQPKAVPVRPERQPHPQHRRRRRTVTFDNLDRPHQDGDRQRHHDLPLRTRRQPVSAEDFDRHFAGTKTVYYVDKLYERVDWSSRPIEEQVYIGPSTVMYRSAPPATSAT